MAYKVPFIDYPLQYQRLEKELVALFKDVLFTRADFIMRGDLEKFEKNMASFVGVKHAIGVNSGTDALNLSLLAAGLHQGDEVITVAHTFVATVAAIIHCGATPVLVDIGSDHNMNVDMVEKAISPRTRAIIPVHLNGRICDMEKLMDIASRHNLLVIEDAAQALGATFDGKQAGSFGLTGCFSFFPAKILGTAGDGGLVTTSDDAIADKIRFLRDNGQRRATGDILYFGFNSRLDNLHAAILDLKLKYVPQWIERRREVAGIYQQGLSNIPGLKLPPPPQTQGHYFDVFQNYVIQTRERDRLVQHLKESGVEVLISWPKPMHHHKALGLTRFRLPETERVSREVLSLPMNTELNNEQVEYIIEAVRKFYSK